MKIISRQEAKRLGLKRYFTGRPCKHGHVCERLISHNCLECLKQYQRDHPEIQKKSHVKHRERRRISNLKWRNANREKVREQHRLQAARRRKRVNIALATLAILKSGELNVNEIASKLR